MKKRGFLLVLLCWMTALLPLQAQNTVLGERVPEVRSEHWLNQVQPAAAPMTVILFFTAATPSGARALTHLHDLAEQLDGRLRVIAVTRDDAGQAASVAADLLSPRLTVAFDSEGRLFRNFGVNYVPFSLLVNERNRLLWQGNPLQLTEKLISTAQ